jgi:hypothetical protein
MITGSSAVCAAQNQNQPVVKVGPPLTNNDSPAPHLVLDF